MLYGMESWTISDRSLKRLEAFEMWVYHRMLRASWTDRMTNASVLERMDKDYEIIKKHQDPQTAVFWSYYEEFQIQNTATYYRRQDRKKTTSKKKKNIMAEGSPTLVRKDVHRIIIHSSGIELLVPSHFGIKNNDFF